jgi:hypothetical protein
MPTPDEGQNNQGNNPPEGATPESWEKYLEAQPEQIKALYTAHTTGLQNAVKATREERDGLAKQLKDLLPKAEKGSEFEKSLTETLTKLEVAERRAMFVEEAVKPEIGCRNPKAAFLLAQAENLFTRSGQPDWNAIKTAAPELFGKPGAMGNGGNGTQDPPRKASMNDFIRHASGR